MFLLRLFAAEDRCAYAICAIIGYVLYLLLRPAMVAPYVAILVTYHMFLIFRLHFSNKDASRTYSLPVTIGAHAGFLLALVAFRFALVLALNGMRTSEPSANLAEEIAIASKAVKLLVVVATYGLAVLERNQLFGGASEKAAAEVAALESMLIEMAAKRNRNSGTLVAATGLDHEAWVRYCARRNSNSYDPTRSPKDDFEQWLCARGKTQYAVTRSEAGAGSN